MTIPEEFIYLFNRQPQIIKYPDERLRQVSSYVFIINKQLDKQLKKEIKLMRDQLLISEGIGLAAPQIGVNKRIIFIESRLLINPEIISTSEETITTQEGCLSIPGLYGNVKRSNKIVLKAQNDKGETTNLTLKGQLAVIAQHEVDHLNGVLFIDKADPESLKWEHPI